MKDEVVVGTAQMHHDNTAVDTREHIDRHSETRDVRKSLYICLKIVSTKIR